MKSIETKKCNIGELPSPLQVKVRRLLSDNESILACVLHRYFVESLFFQKVKDEWFTSYLVTDRRCILVTPTSSRHLQLSEVSNISYYEDVYYNPDDTFLGGFATFNVVVQCATQIHLSFQFATKLLAHEFNEILDQAIATVHTNHKSPPAAAADRLRDLQRLLEQGLVDASEYEDTRRRILSEL